MQAALDLCAYDQQWGLLLMSMLQFSDCNWLVLAKLLVGSNCKIKMWQLNNSMGNERLFIPKRFVAFYVYLHTYTRQFDKQRADKFNLPPICISF